MAPHLSDHAAATHHVEEVIPPTDSSEAWPTDEVSAAVYASIAAGAHADGPRGRIIFCVSTDDLSESKGDPYVALGLARYLLDRGWGVSLWPMHRWAERPEVDPTIAIVMIDSFVPAMLPEATATIAWVRNWTETWAALPWLAEFDGVWCSSSSSAAVLQPLIEIEVDIMPIGIDPLLFSGDPASDRSFDVVTTVNFWGAERQIQEALSALSARVEVTWFGANAEHLARAQAIRHADHVDFFKLAGVYRNASVVVDDLIDAARPFGSHNSRLFEAIACGAVPVTNTSVGLDELGLGEVPSYESAEELESIVKDQLADDDGRMALAGRLAEVVRTRHGYAMRADRADIAFPAVLARAGQRGSRDAVLSWALAQWKTAYANDATISGRLREVRQLGLRIASLESELDGERRAVAALSAENDTRRAALDRVRRSRLQNSARRASDSLERYRLWARAGRAAASEPRAIVGRGRAKIGRRIAAARAASEQRRLLAGRFPITRRAIASIDGGETHVLMCLWNRPERIGDVLEMLDLQDFDGGIRLFLWNNNPRDHAHYLREIDRFNGSGTLREVSLARSPSNVGSIGRFYWARRLLATSGVDTVIVLDDDQEVRADFVSEAMRARRSRTLAAWWAWTITGGYWERRPPHPGEQIDHIGPGGMVADTAIFADPRFFTDIPRRFAMLDDIWLTNFARNNGYQLAKLDVEIDFVSLEKNQYLGQHDIKSEFYDYLARQ